MSVTKTLLISLLLFIALAPHSALAMPIMGTPTADVERMYSYVVKHNPEFRREVAEAFINIGERYGVRGDIALCQAIIETGWFRFDNGTAVTPDAHNYCGLGVQARGETGCSFSSVEEGVTAMIQHLYAYASTEAMPKGETVIDPRFNYVKRGCAPQWEDLAGKWAMNPAYAENILRIFESMSNHRMADRKVLVREVQIPDDAFLSDEELVLDTFSEENNETN